jgi:hypothetical protein
MAKMPMIEIGLHSTNIITSISSFDVDGVDVGYFAVVFPFGYFNKNDVSRSEIHDWCVENFSKEDDPCRWDMQWYMRGSAEYYFKSEEDRNWFILRWS